MKKSSLKTFLIFCITIFLLISQCEAMSVNSLKGNTEGTESIKNVGNNLITVFTTIGSIISVIVLIILGIKYMMGSVEERAEYKKTMLPYIVGVVIIFAASTITGIIYNISLNL